MRFSYTRLRTRRQLTIFLFGSAMVLCVLNFNPRKTPDKGFDEVVYELPGMPRPLSSTSGGLSQTIPTLSTEHNCQFNSGFNINMEKLGNITFDRSIPWMKRLGFYKTPSQTTSFPVFVTAADDRYMELSYALIKSMNKLLLPRYPKLKLIFYDVGLNRAQRNWIWRECSFCVLRPHPLRNLPPHTRVMGTFAFKPIMINTVFQEYGFVWWADASVRFVSRDLDRPLQYLQENNVLFFTYDKVLNVALHTNRQTFKYFNEDPCPFKYFGEIQAGNIAFRNSRESRMILRKWVECALDERCIAPVTPGANIFCKPAPEVMSDDDVGMCHRYDQSVLSLILRRLYHEQNDYPIVDKPFKIISLWNRDEEIL